MIESITAEKFAPYGIVLEFSAHPEDTRFEVVLQEPNSPWRLAMYRVKEKSFHQLEQHPLSHESFEPVQGVGVLVVAAPQSPAKMHAFVLDKPICLNKGVWHQMITLTEETIVKISENLEVESCFYECEKSLTVDLCEAGRA